MKSKEDLFIYFYDKATRACLLADDCEVNPPTLVSDSKIQRLGCIFLLPPHPAGLIIFLSWNDTNKLTYKTERDSVQFSSVTQSCPTLCDPMNCSTPGLPVHHQLLEFTQTHFHWVGEAIQSSHPLSSPSPPAWDLGNEFMAVGGRDS